MPLDSSVAEVCRTLDEGYPSAEAMTALLRSEDEAVVHAVVLHLDRRLREGDQLDGWSRMLPDEVFAMPPESQIVLAKLSVDGFSMNALEAPETLPTFVRLAWLRAGLLERPESLPRYEDTPLGWAAVSDLPCERVIAKGLLERMLESGSANVRELTLSYLRTGVERGLLHRMQAHEHLLRLAHDSSASIAIEALRLLKEAWTFAIPLSPLRLSLGDDIDLSREVAHVFAARREVHPIRRWLAGDVLPSLVPELLTALGESGDANDIASILEHIHLDPFRCGQPGLKALVALKRRGVSPNDDEARALLALLLEHAGLDAEAAAEVMSSRADIVVDALDVVAPADPHWPSIVSLLESFGTRRAIERLRSIVARAEERAGWWYAVRALGRLGARDAEADILARLDDEPDACLDALRYVGGEQTVRTLCERVSKDPPPVWLQPAVKLAFQLDPSNSLFEQLARRGLLSSDILDSLPGHGSLAQSDAMRTIVTQHGDPLRVSAIRASGRTGGPLSVDMLGEVVADPEDEVRNEALAALRTLGPRLQKQGAVRPACLESSADAAGTLVADVILQRLRARSLEPDVVVRLLDSLIGLGHPHLVSVVRPYLRHKAPEVRKKVIACLGSAGPEASAWIFPWVSDEDVTVARQALQALTHVQASGFAESVARGLDAKNMNVKKTAAEALARIGDRTVVPNLLHWLGSHDNPGFRQLLVSALKAILGSWFVTALVDRLSAAEDERMQELLLDGLQGELSASDVASLVRLRGPSAPARDGEWTGLLLRRIYEGEWTLSAGTVASLDQELERRGLSDRIPKDARGTRADSAWRVKALQSGVELRRALHESSSGQHEILGLVTQLDKANVRGQMIVPRLSRSEVHALLDVYDRLNDEGKAGALQVLAVTDLDPVARLRAGRFLRERSHDKVPATLMRCAMGTTTASHARRMMEWPDSAVQESAMEALVLDDEVDVELWPTTDAPLLLTHLVRRGSLDLCFTWSREKGHLPDLVRTLHRLRGAAFAVARIRRWIDADPTLLATILPEILRLGPSADLELERLARSSAVELRLREQIVTALGGRVPSVSRRALFRELLGCPHATLRERAARDLWRLAHRSDRKEIVEAFLAGAFREHFSIRLEHVDLPLVERAVRDAQGPARLRLVRLVATLEDPLPIALLVDLWQTSEEEAKALCRDALRAIDPARVLPFIQKNIDAGDASILDVLGPLRNIPQRLVGAYERSSDSSVWARFFERMSGGHTLHAPGLSEVLARRFREDTGDRAAIRLFAHLDDWSDATKVHALAGAIQPALEGDDREELLRSIVEATAAVGVALRVRVLTSIGRITDEPIVLALMDTVLENALVRDALPAPMRGAIERRMSRELDGAAERGRRILSYLATHAKTEAERAELILVLERSLRHRSPRVRLHAHRLLRNHADRSRYLAATRVLLDDADPTTVRSAIRVIAFGGHVEAVSELAELLFHSHASVRGAVRAGLVHLGKDAVPTLVRALGRARPDRRPALTEVLDEIERGGGKDDEDCSDMGEHEERDSQARD